MPQEKPGGQLSGNDAGRGGRREYHQTRATSPAKRGGDDRPLLKEPLPCNNVWPPLELAWQGDGVSLDPRQFLWVRRKNLGQVGRVGMEHNILEREGAQNGEQQAAI